MSYQAPNAAVNQFEAAATEFWSAAKSMRATGSRVKLRPSYTNLIAAAGGVGYRHGPKDLVAALERWIAEVAASPIPTLQWAVAEYGFSSLLAEWSSETVAPTDPDRRALDLAILDGLAEQAHADGCTPSGVVVSHISTQGAVLVMRGRRDIAIQRIAGGHVEPNGETEEAMVAGWNTSLDRIVDELPDGGSVPSWATWGLGETFQGGPTRAGHDSNSPAVRICAATGCTNSGHKSNEFCVEHIWAIAKGEVERDDLIPAAPARPDPDN
ncbi:MAG: hypothetical protein R8F63_09070 [Acidimicrobiales bacterium]|nr:hypothetical protein [Acidimicrobiales bacterium]